MKNRIIRCISMLVLLSVLATLVAVPLASAASYSKVYGKTTDRIRVRESASTNATIIDNIIKDACVYVTSSSTNSGNTFVQIKYRNADGDVTTGWACQSDGKNTYIKILSASQAEDAFGVKSGNLPSKKVGTFTAAERNASKSSSDNTYIKLNSSGTAVKDLQTKLQKLGYYSAELTGNCGPKTVAAIKSFQSAYGLTADGVAGPSTLAKVDAAYSAKGSSTSGSTSGSALRLNSQGTKVRDLQSDLTALGYYWATISGNFGEKTETAVKRFQEEHGLTPDGVAGTKTLEAIKEALAKKGVSSSSSSTASSTGSTLKLDSQGTKVAQLQQDLTTLKYYYADITGNFGPKTEDAVKAFQKAKGLTADGVAGPKTLEAIAAAVKVAGGSSSGSAASGSGLKIGSTGTDVKNLQKDLTTLGYYYGDVTGHYGQLTESAVKKFQKSRGLTQDGVAGAKTLAAVESAVEGTGGISAGSTGSATSYRKGDKSNVIKDMQTRLKSLKYYYGDITGTFGDLTEKAVKKFQDDHGLTVDGIAGQSTLNKLYSLTGGAGSTGGTSTGGSTVTTANSYGRIIKNNVYLRAAASTSSASKASLGNGTLVRITQIKTDSTGTNWYYISVKLGNYTYKGYVRADMLETISESEYNAGGGNSDVNVGDMETLGMIKITGDNVRLRYSPSTDATSVGTANKGDTFYYIDSVSGWYQTKSGYWISSSYAKVMSSDEIASMGGSSSSSSSSAVYKYGSSGSQVTYIKNALATLGYYSGNIGPSFGYQTEAAVKAFQRDHGLSADGIVGSKTMAAITAALAGVGGSGGSTGYNDVIYNLSWTKTVDGSRTGKALLANLGLSSGKTVKLTDISTGLSFNCYVQSCGNHADLEPSSAADTATMCRIYGVGTAGDIPYNRRAMVMTVGSVQVVCSIYGEVHGQQNITNNNFGGQFCCHFLDSTIHSGDGGSVSDSENHQAIIANAVTKLKTMKSANGNTIQVRTKYPE